MPSILKMHAEVDGLGFGLAASGLLRTFAGSKHMAEERDVAHLCSEETCMVAWKMMDGLTHGKSLHPIVIGAYAAWCRTL
jgi:hypothetical protein